MDSNLNKETNNLSPIVIFCCKRPNKLNNLLVSLESNLEFKNSDLYFYVDNVDNEIDKTLHDQVLVVINKNWDVMSKNIYIRDEKFGLKKNIISGINQTFERFEKAIFLEDDLVVGKQFLNFMNSSLEMYKNQKKVMHISGYNFPTFFGDRKSAYFSIYMNCWGWATWRDRWKLNNNFSKNIISDLSDNDRRKFNVFGLEKDYESQLIRNSVGILESWAIYWTQFIFLNEGVCLQPIKSLVDNQGNDSQAQNSSIMNFYRTKINQNKIDKFPKKIKVKKFYLLQIVIFFIYKKIRKKLKL